MRRSPSAGTVSATAPAAGSRKGLPAPGRGTALTAPYGTADVGLVIGAPDPGAQPEGLTIALGPAGTLEHLPESFAGLKRFQQLTGADLHDPQDLIEVSWALATEHGSPGSFQSDQPSPRG